MLRLLHAADFHLDSPFSGLTAAQSAQRRRELRQLQSLIDEAQAEADSIRDAIKAAMGASESMTAGEYKITWKNVTSARIDTSALKKALPDVAERFTKETIVRRFSVA